MKGNEILVSTGGAPRGVFMEGTIEGTPKPGTIVQIKAATAADGGGNFTFEAYNRDDDGNHPQGPYAVLLPDELNGKSYADAYANGDHCYVYIPQIGEQLNLLVSAAGTGTGDSVAVGALLIVDDGTGLLVATTGTPESEPFMALEALADADIDGELVWCVFTGY